MRRVATRSCAGPTRVPRVPRGQPMGIQGTCVYSVPRPRSFGAPPKLEKHIFLSKIGRGIIGISFVGNANSWHGILLEGRYPAKSESYEGQGLAEIAAQPL